MRISDWSSDVCSSDLAGTRHALCLPRQAAGIRRQTFHGLRRTGGGRTARRPLGGRSRRLPRHAGRGGLALATKIERKMTVMLLDIRTYRVKPGQLKAQFELYAKYGKPAQTKHLGQPLAFLRTETGDPNAYVHIWVYENAGDRKKKRAEIDRKSVV